MKKDKKKKKSLQFSQKLALTIVIFSMAIVFYAITLNALLIFLDKYGMAQETIATVTTFGAITSTAGVAIYGALSGWRDHSKNKFGVTHIELNNQPENNDMPKG